MILEESGEFSAIDMKPMFGAKLYFGSSRIKRLVIICIKFEADG